MQFGVREASSDYWTDGSSVHDFFTYGEYGYNFIDKDKTKRENFVALLQGNKISAEVHSGNSKLGITCFTTSIFNV